MAEEPAIGDISPLYWEHHNGGDINYDSESGIHNLIIKYTTTQAKPRSVFEIGRKFFHDAINMDSVFFRYIRLRSIIGIDGVEREIITASHDDPKICRVEIASDIHVILSREITIRENTTVLHIGNRDITGGHINFLSTGNDIARIIFDQANTCLVIDFMRPKNEHWIMEETEVLNVQRYEVELGISFKDRLNKEAITKIGPDNAVLTFD